MLTQTDLKQIANVINKSIDTRVPPIVERIINTRVSPIVERIIDVRVPLIIDIKLKPIKKMLKKIDGDLRVVNNFYDHEVLKLDKRVTTIEDHLRIPSTSN